MLKQLEQKLNELLVTKAPFQLPASVKSALVPAMPWLALVGGVLTLWSAWSLYQLVTWADRWLGWSSGVNNMYGYTAVGKLGPMVWLSIAVLIAQGVLLLLAFKGLKARKKIGWNWLFLVSLLNVANAVVYLFVDNQIGTLLLSLLGSVFGLYLLFQMRSAYLPSAKSAAKSTSSTSAKKK